MSWRVVTVSSIANLDYKMDYLVVRTQEATRRIHLSEISVLVIESTAVSLTAYLLCELAKRKIDVVFCDENSSPWGTVLPFYGSHDTENLSMAEKLLQYMKVSRELLGKKLFFFINLKSFLDTSELENFYQTILYEKHNILLIEGFQRETPRECEIFKIIDKALCEL